MIFLSKSLKKTFIKSHIPIFQISSQCSNNIILVYSNLIDHSLSLKSLVLSKFIHARLIKVGLNIHIFLGNRLLDLYSKLGTIDDALQAFHDLPNKNSITWNVLLKVLFKFGHVERARCLFDEMPKRDVVCWNSMISGYASNGFVDSSLRFFLEMQRAGVRPNGFTFSILTSCTLCIRQGKQIHGSIVRSGLNSSNIVLGNCLIDMYGELMLLDYAFGVFLTMEELDVISWNSLILGCDKSGYRELALNQFCSMRSSGYSPDNFTMSNVIKICSNLQVLKTGKQVFALCFEMGFLSNSVVSSAIIDMFSKCDKLEDSVFLFKETHRWDMLLCNSMISGYARHGFEEEALRLFVLTLRKNFKPTEFTLSSTLNSASFLFPAEEGIQIHSLVLKMGFQSDMIVASSLVDMYAKYGLIDDSFKIFSKMGIKDLISWNIMIIGFARNGQEIKALEIFEELCERGSHPDRITLAGVLLACSHKGFVNEGKCIFSSMEEKYGVIPRVEHYACMVDMMCRADRLTEAIEIIETMPHHPNASVWGLLLRACAIHGDLKLTERVAETVMELESSSSLPYLVLARIYGMRGKWESVARVMKAMKERGVKKERECSWVGIKNQVFAFEANQILHYGGESIYSILGLLFWEMGDEGYICQRYDDDVVWDGWEN